MCRAIASAITSPNSSPPPNATPTPTPSVNEWMVITPTIISTDRVGSADGAEVRMAVALEHAPAGGDEDAAPQDPEQDSHGRGATLPDEPDARPGHRAGASAFAVPSDDRSASR